MKISQELAEILGMFAADGCLQKQYVCMWGNIYEDKDYYNNIVCPFYSKVFNIKVIAHEKKSNSVYGFYICNKKVINFFRDLGFTNNKTYDVRIPEIVMNSKDKKIWKDIQDRIQKVEEHYRKRVKKLTDNKAKIAKMW